MTPSTFCAAEITASPYLMFSALLIRILLRSEGATISGMTIICALGKSFFADSRIFVSRLVTSSIPGPEGTSLEKPTTKNRLTYFLSLPSSATAFSY